VPQSYTSLHCHVTFGTKDRRPHLTTGLRSRVFSYMAGIAKNEKGLLLAAGGTQDHVHLLVGLHAETAVAGLLRVMKANSSKWIHENFPDESAFAWQAGYGAFSVSRSNLDSVRAYIENQEEHHRRLSFEEEFRVLLERHGIEYDPRYLWG